MEPFVAFTRCATIASAMLAGLAQAATLTPGETVALQPSLQVTLDSTAAVLGSPPASVRNTLAWRPSVRSVDVDATKGNLLSAQLDGGFRLEAQAVRNVQQGGILAVNNLRVDFVRSHVDADLVVSEGRA